MHRHQHVVLLYLAVNLVVLLVPPYLVVAVAAIIPHLAAVFMVLAMATYLARVFEVLLLAPPNLVLHSSSARRPPP